MARAPLKKQGPAAWPDLKPAALNFNKSLAKKRYHLCLAFTFTSTQSDSLVTP